jgi:hypothetical protein
MAANAICQQQRTVQKVGTQRDSRRSYEPSTRAAVGDASRRHRRGATQGYCGDSGDRVRTDKNTDGRTEDTLIQRVVVQQLAQTSRGFSPHAVVIGEVGEDKGQG